MTKTTWTPAMIRLILKRYPREGASQELADALGVHRFQLRHKATRLGVRVNADVKRAKQYAYNLGRMFDR